MGLSRRQYVGDVLSSQAMRRVLAFGAGSPLLPLTSSPRVLLLGRGLEALEGLSSVCAPTQGWPPCAKCAHGSSSGLKCGSLNRGWGGAM